MIPYRIRVRTNIGTYRLVPWYVIIRDNIDIYIHMWYGHIEYVYVIIRDNIDIYIFYNNDTNNGIYMVSNTCTLL